MTNAKTVVVGTIGILLLATTMFLSCRKENHEEPTKSKVPVMREIEDTEADDLISETNAFYEFSQELLSDEHATSSFPTDIAPIEAVRLIENTFNYNFSQLDYSLFETKTVTATVEYSVDGHGNVSSKSAALAFNDARESLKAAYDELIADDKKLLFVDVEDGDGVYLVKGVIAFDPNPHSLNANSTFGADDTWSLFSGLTPLSTSAGYIDQYDVHHTVPYGAPQVLREYIFANLGYLTMAINWFPVNITPDAWSGNSNANNPMASTCWVRGHDLHWTEGVTPGTGCYDANPLVESFITPAAMNFYRGTILPGRIAAVQTTYTKFMIDIHIEDYAEPTAPFEPRHMFRTWVADKVLASGNAYNL